MTTALTPESFAYVEFILPILWLYRGSYDTVEFDLQITDLSVRLTRGTTRRQVIINILHDEPYDVTLKIRDLIIGLDRAVNAISSSQ